VCNGLAGEGAVKVRNECANERTNAEAKRLERSRRSIPKVRRWEFEFAQGTAGIEVRMRVKSVMIPIGYYHSPGQSHIYMSVVVKNKNMNFMVRLREIGTKSQFFWESHQCIFVTQTR
jgi:hypothetical protein